MKTNKEPNLVAFPHIPWYEKFWILIDKKKLNHALSTISDVRGQNKFLIRNYRKLQIDFANYRLKHPDEGYLRMIENMHNDGLKVQGERLSYLYSLVQKLPKRYRSKFKGAF